MAQWSAILFFKIEALNLIFQLGNVNFLVQHTQNRVKSYVTNFYPKMPQGV